MAPNESGKAKAKQGKSRCHHPRDFVGPGHFMGPGHFVGPRHFICPRPFVGPRDFMGPPDFTGPCDFVGPRHFMGPRHFVGPRDFLGSHHFVGPHGDHSGPRDWADHLPPPPWFGHHLHPREFDCDDESASDEEKEQEETGCQAGEPLAACGRRGCGRPWRAWGAPGPRQAPGRRGMGAFRRGGGWGGGWMMGRGGYGRGGQGGCGLGRGGHGRGRGAFFGGGRGGFPRPASAADLLAFPPPWASDSSSDSSDSDDDDDDDTAGDYEATFDLKLYKRKRISVRVAGRVLVVEARGRERRESGRHQGDTVSRRYFVETRALPRSADSRRMTAILSREDGVLSVRAPSRDDEDQDDEDAPCPYVVVRVQDAGPRVESGEPASEPMQEADDVQEQDI